MVRALVVAGIVVATLVLLYLVARLVFLLTIKATLQRFLVRLDVSIRNSSDLLESISAVLEAHGLGAAPVREAVFPATALATTSLALKRASIRQIASAKSFLDQIPAGHTVRQDQDYILLKANLDDVQGAYLSLEGEYNREVRLFNRHLRMLTGRLLGFCFRLSPKESL